LRQEKALVIKLTKQTKKCDKDKELNPKTNRCNKKCEDGYERNNDFKCVKTRKNR
jgi:hypothetical protein